MSSPFDEARYVGLLEGLEVSILSRSEFLKNNRTERLDSEFFRKEFLNAPKFDLVLGEHALVRSGTTPPDREDDLERGVILLKTVDIQNRVLATQNADNFYKISPEIAKRMSQTRLQPRDVLINIVGATTDVVGRVGLIPIGFPEANITQAMALVRAQDKTLVPEVLFAFFSGKFGQQQIRRLARPTGQYNLNLKEVESLRIPKFSAEFSTQTERLITTSQDIESSALEFVAFAEKALVDALGLENWQAPEPLTYSRSSRDAFTAERFDAEHFKPKYVELVARMKAKGQTVALGSLLAVNQRGKQPEYADEGLPVVNSKHVTNGEVRLNDDNRSAVFLKDAVPIEPGDVLINGTGVGTIGRAAPYLHDFKALPDNHVTILRPKKAAIDPVYLAVFLNSFAGQMQVEQRLSGSSGQIELYPKDIAEFAIWVAPADVQSQVRAAVENSFTAKKRAAQLLNAAKRAVEIAIEDSEAAALAWLAQAQTQIEA